MPDATTRGPWDDVQRKVTEVLDPALEAIKWGLEETMRARDAEIRELKARNEYLTAALDQMLAALFDGLVGALGLIYRHGNKLESSNRSGYDASQYRQEPIHRSWQR